MKRSFINAVIRENISFLDRMGFRLPPFAFWPPERWAAAGDDVSEIRENRLGWDMTDYGGGDYARLGLFLFTLRNGNLSNPACRKTYAEKLLIVGEEQITPTHFHFSKMEDIINRGGGNLCVRVHNAADDETLDGGDVAVNVDGRAFRVPAGTVITLTPGESITLPPRQYHSFWGEAGKGTVLVGEVSAVNDDVSDNRFLENLPRFSTVEEDEKAQFVLCNEYGTR